MSGLRKSQDEPVRPVPGVQGAASFSKFIAVLQAIADEPGKLDMARLGRRVTYPRGTLYRIVTALIAENLVTQNRETGALHLGHRLIHFASKSWETSDLRSSARDHIEALRNATGETVHLAVPSGTGMVYIDKLESPRAVRMMSRIGTRVEMHSTSVGKAYLAALSAERCREIVESLDMRPRTGKTITDVDALLAEIERTRARGYSFDNEENEPDIRCIGGAIVDRSGQAVGAVSLSIPLYRYDEARADFYIDKVRETVTGISGDLATVV